MNDDQHDVHNSQQQGNDHQVVVDRMELLAEGEIVQPVEEPGEGKTDPPVSRLTALLSFSMEISRDKAIACMGQAILVKAYEAWGRQMPRIRTTGMLA